MNHDRNWPIILFKAEWFVALGVTITISYSYTFNLYKNVRTNKYKLRVNEIVFRTRNFYLKISSRHLPKFILMCSKKNQFEFLSVSGIVMHLSCYMLLLLLNVFSCCSKVYIKKYGFTIIGLKFKTIFDKSMYSAFYRIPYAEPPIKELRFKAPKMLKPFRSNNTYDFSKVYTNKRINAEDCLYLSVFTPISSNKSKSFPILVWPHKQSSKFGPDFFIDEEVLLVTVNFRTSVFGFLNTEDEFAEGNMGSKDILMALQWLQDNISLLNGDPNRITIIGSGDAATSVASIILTTTADNLVRRAIIIDGSALSPADYRIYNFEVANKLYWKLKESFGHFDRKALYSSLNNVSATELIMASSNLYDSTEVRDKQRLINAFSCSLENSGGTAFMSKSPVDIYDEKTISKVEVIFGFTTLPLLFKLGGLLENRILLKYLNYNFQYLLPFEGKYDEYESKRYRKIRRKILDFYFLNGTITEVSLKRYSKYVSDQVIYPLLRQAGLHSKISKGNVYLYRFPFNGSLNIRWRTLVPNLKWKGATLGDEICYLFRCKSQTDVYNNFIKENERSFIRKIVRLFANFAKCGDPTPQRTDDILASLKWLPLKENKPLRAINFGNNFKMVEVPEDKRLRFWNKLMEEYF